MNEASNLIMLLLQEYLKPLLVSDEYCLSDKDRTYRADIALRCLHAFYLHFSAIPPVELSSVVDAIADCVQCCIVMKPRAKDHLTVSKVLAHLVSKSSVKVRICSFDPMKFN